MPNFIFLAFIYFIEGFIVYSYIQSIYSPKKSNSISFTITIFLYFTLLLVYRFVFNNEIFNTFLIIIINICGYSVVGNLKYDIYYLKKELRQEEIRLDELKAKVDTNSSIREIEEKAKEELNMDYLKKNQIRYIEVEN